METKPSKHTLDSSSTFVTFSLVKPRFQWLAAEISLGGSGNTNLQKHLAHGYHWLPALQSAEAQHIWVILSFSMFLLKYGSQQEDALFSCSPHFPLFHGHFMGIQPIFTPIHQLWPAAAETPSPTPQGYEQISHRVWESPYIGCWFFVSPYHQTTRILE